MVRGNQDIEVNLNTNSVQIYCPHCGKRNCSKNTARLLEEQIFDLQILHNSTIPAELDVICDFCHKTFQKKCWISRWYSVYFLEDR